MSFFSVNRNKCCHDGACVAVCPVEILKLDQECVPVPIDGAEDICIHCGHCVAVCPTAAISLNTMAAQDCEQLATGWNLSLDKVGGLLKGRRSIRTFQKQAVPRVQLENFVDIARFAPSGINRQPVCWSIVAEPSQVREVSRMVVAWMKEQLAAQTPMSQGLHMESIVSAWEKGRDRVCRSAPHLVIAYALADDMTAPQAGTIAFTYLELAAISAGIGACWAGYVQVAAQNFLPLKKFLGLRSREVCLGAMMLGYPQYSYHRIPTRMNSRIKWVGQKMLGNDG